MKIPKKIHWNGKDFTVHIDKQLDGGENWGRTMIGVQEIHIEKDVHSQKQEQTFIHELLHITFRGSGLAWNEKDEERAVNAWAQNVYGILKDNNLLR